MILGTQSRFLLALQVCFLSAATNDSLRPPLKLENQRLDCDGDGAGGFQDFAEVDEVEVVEGDAVDGEDVVLEIEDEADGPHRRLGIRVRRTSLLPPFPKRLVCTQSEPIALLLTRWRFAQEDQAKESVGPFPIRVLR